MFTKEKAVGAKQALSKMFDALSRPKKSEMLSALNDVSLFLEAAERVAKTDTPDYEAACSECGAPCPTCEQAIAEAEAPGKRRRAR